MVHGSVRESIASDGARASDWTMMSGVRVKKKISSEKVCQLTVEMV